MFEEYTIRTLIFYNLFKKNILNSLFIISYFIFVEIETKLKVICLFKINTIFQYRLFRIKEHVTSRKLCIFTSIINVYY